MIYNTYVYLYTTCTYIHLILSIQYISFSYSKEGKKHLRSLLYDKLINDRYTRNYRKKNKAMRFVFFFFREFSR